LSGKYEEMQYNEVDFDETPDVSELEALKRSTGVSTGVRAGIHFAVLLPLLML
jgi:hypothetical protein